MQHPNQAQAATPRTFAAWLDDTFRAPGEARTRAVSRFAIESGLGVNTVYRALRGQRIRAAQATRVVEFSRGQVDIVTLMLGREPTPATAESGGDDA